MSGGDGCARVVRGREPEEGRSTGESERGQGGQGWRRGEDARRRGGQATQADSLVAWRPRARRRAPLCLPGERKQVAGTGQHSAGPASGLAGLPGERQVSSPSLLFLFFFCSVSLWHY